MHKERNMVEFQKPHRQDRERILALHGGSLLWPDLKRNVLHGAFGRNLQMTECPQQNHRIKGGLCGQKSLKVPRGLCRRAGQGRRP